jgi:uncharacterized protein (UPF0332 family)
MSNEYGDCLKRGKIKPFSRGQAIAPKELETAFDDICRARKTFEEKDYKWATVQIYYAMFHAARALLYAKNLREHSHFCLISSIRELYVNNGLISVQMIEGLQEAKNLREDADYYSRWSEAGCARLLSVAEEFLEVAKKLL